MKKILTLTILAAALTSCGEVDSDGDGIVDSATIISADTKTIDEDSYRYIQFELNRNADINVTANLISGPSIEIYFIDQQAFNSWETVASTAQWSSASFSNYQELSIAPLGSSFDSGMQRVEAGTYYLLMENTDYGNTNPPFNFVNDVAVVEYSIIAN